MESISLNQRQGRNFNAQGAMMGRPSKYKEEYAEQVYALCLLGLTDKEMCGVFGVAEKTFNTWKQKHSEFLQSIKKGKEPADAEVAVKLRERALGYSHPEERLFLHEGEVIRAETTKHYPPDTAAAFIWLKNRQPKLWRDKADPFGNDEPAPEPIQVTIVDGRKPKAE